MMSSGFAQWLAGNLNGSLEVAASLDEALKSERAALEQQNQEALSRSLADKTARVAELKSFEEQREARCRAEGFAAGAHDMEKVLAALNNVDLSAAWERLLEVASELSAANQTNGYIIQSRSQLIERGLSTIFGGQDVGATYAAGGTTPASPGQRTLAQA